MSKGKRIGYVRVSTADQNPERQLESILLDKKFTEYASGRSLERPQLKNLIDYVREDDIVIVHSLDRLARNVKDLRNVIDELISKKTSIQFVKENLTFNGADSPMSNLLLIMIGAIAEFEHSLIRERQLEGIALAKRQGKFRGSRSKFTEQMREDIKREMQTRKSKCKIAQELGISRECLYQYIRKIQKIDHSL